MVDIESFFEVGIRCIEQMVGVTRIINTKLTRKVLSLSF